MYKIAKRFDFCASHQLRELPNDHQCARLHGHNYSVTVHLGSQTLDEVGFIKDYGELDAVKAFIDENLEHRHLNDVFNFNPTAENIAKWFFDSLIEDYSQLIGVTIKETEKTEAYYSPSKEH